MRQKTKNHQDQGSLDKKFDFFPQSLSHIPRWVHLVQKTRAKNSHAWAPLRSIAELRAFYGYVLICLERCLLPVELNVELIDILPRPVHVHAVVGVGVASASTSN